VHKKSHTPKNTLQRKRRTTLFAQAGLPRPNSTAQTVHGAPRKLYV
jgi:hypothetical protein